MQCKLTLLAGKSSLHKCHCHYHIHKPEESSRSITVWHRRCCQVAALCLLYNRIERLEGGCCNGRPDVHGSDVTGVVHISLVSLKHE